MDKSRVIQALSALIRNEIQETDALLELLRKEREQVHGNPDHLTMLSEEKLALIIRLEQQSQKRNTVLTECGFAPDKNGMLALIHWCDDKSGKLIEQWNLLENRIRECRTQNQLNGRVMDISLKAVRQSLAILYGQLDQDSGYDAGGSETSQKLSRSIAKA